MQCQAFVSIVMNRDLSFLGYNTMLMGKYLQAFQ